MKKALTVTAIVFALMVTVHACAQNEYCPKNICYHFTSTCTPNYWYITYSWTTKEDGGEDRIKITTPNKTYCMDATHTGTNKIGPIYISDISKVTFQGYYGNDCYGDPCPQNLPVAIASFEGRRENSHVKLVWETASEQNNQGFNVQRFVQSDWISVSFVPTKAADGNSESVLRYVYTEQFPATAAVQYRLEQADLDGKKTYSAVIAVPGSNSLSATAYCRSNTVTLMFPDLSMHQVSLVDMLGRELQKVTQSGTIYLNNVRSGSYALRIFDESGTLQQTKKLVMQ